MKRKYYAGLGILISYSFVVGILQVMSLIDKVNLNIMTITVVLFLAIGVSLLCMRAFQQKHIISRTVMYNRKERIIGFTGGTILTFLVLMVWYAAFFPGVFSSDSFTQYSQVVNGGINDWHPFMHTILFFWLPWRLFHSIAAIVVCQMLYFSFIVGYLIYTLMCLQSPKQFILVTFAYTVLNPHTGTILLHPWKDCAFGMFILLGITYFMRIYFSDGKWLQGKRNCFVFSVILSLTMLMRHNAVLYVAPMVLVIVILYYKNSKQAVMMMALTIVLIVAFCKYPLNHIIGVGKPEQRQGESLGLPLTMLGNVVQNAPEILSDDAREFLYEFASQGEWENKYITGSWNSIKWQGGDRNLIEQEGYKNILKYTWEAIIRSPEYSVQAFVRLTDMVWGIDDNKDIGLSLSMADNDFNVVQKGNDFLKTQLNEIILIFGGSNLRYIFYQIGTVMLTLITLACVRYKSLIRNIILILPVFAYNFGTMLLLSGNDFRFFMYNFWIIFPYIFILMADIKEKDKREIIR